MIHTVFSVCTKLAVLLAPNEALSPFAGHGVITVTVFQARADQKAPWKGTAEDARLEGSGERGGREESQLSDSWK